MSKEIDTEVIQDAVRDRYGRIARECSAYTGGCCGGHTGCGDPATLLGYSNEQIAAIPQGADLGLGCGTPLASAALRAGETVLDLGSGAGFDCFLAAREVGPSGRVIGVDMTEDMITRATANADKGGFRNVDFRLGQLENLPVDDSSVGVIISNCVVNLCPNKRQVFREAFRVLKPGGRVAISDVVTPIPLPREVRRDLSLHTGCLAGASLISDLRAILEECGFTDIRITPKSESREFIKDWAPGRKLEDFVVSAVIEAEKPLGKGGEIG
jgi:arsenite methyltransferase